MGQKDWLSSWFTPATKNQADQLPQLWHSVLYPALCGKAFTVTLESSSLEWPLDLRYYAMRSKANMREKAGSQSRGQTLESDQPDQRDQRDGLLRDFFGKVETTEGAVERWLRGETEGRLADFRTSKVRGLTKQKQHLVECKWCGDPDGCDSKISCTMGIFVIDELRHFEHRRCAGCNDTTP